MPQTPMTGRLAPSPTGALHVGHALSFLAAWWSARRQGGHIVLRFEDIDADRASDAHVRQGLEDLRWLGIDWDGAPIIQSMRLPSLKEAASVLQSRGLAYPCVCTRRDLAAAEEPSGAPHDPSAARYPGTCRGRFETIQHAETSTGREAGLRFAVPDEQTTFFDQVYGKTTSHVTAEVGDFLVLRRNKVPAYQLAVVVDDHTDGVTEVVRGRDLLASTARQLLLARTLGYPSPSYAHVPLVCDSTGKRLAKRDAVTGLSELRSQGIRPEQIICWAWRSLGQGSVGDMASLASRFEWSRVPRDDILLPDDMGSAF